MTAVAKRPYRIDSEVAHARAVNAGVSRTTTEYYVAKLVEKAPELTAEQRDKLALLLRSA